MTIQEKISEGWQKAKEAVPLEDAADADQQQDDQQSAQANDQQQGDDQQQNADQQQQADDQQSQQQGDQQPAAAAADTPEFDDGLDLGPQDFASKIKGTETEKWLDANPEIKGQLFRALRNQEETRGIRELIPDVETAKIVTQGAATWTRFDNKFLGATTPEGVKDLLGYLTNMAMYVDGEGKPVVENGKYKFHPALTQTFDTIFNNKLAGLEKVAKDSNNERLLAALDILREVTAPPSPGLDEVPEELKPFAEQIKKDREALNAEKEEGNRRAQAEKQTANEQSIERAEVKAETSVVAQLEPRFKLAGLSEFESKAALQRIGQLLDEKLAASDIYQSILESILRRPPSEAREKDHAAHLMRYTQQYLGKITTQVLKEAKSGALTRQTERDAKRDQQVLNSQTSPKGGSITAASPQNVGDPKALDAQLSAEWEKAHPGEPVDLRWKMAQIFERTKDLKGRRA